MQKAYRGGTAVARLLLFALLINSVFLFTADNGITGDGGGSPPIPPPQPSGPFQPPVDSLTDTMAVSLTAR